MLDACRLHTQLRQNSLYLMVTRGDDLTGDPVPLSLIGLRPESVMRLRELLRGDVVPADILAEMVALAPRFVGEQLAPGHDDRRRGSGPVS